MPAAMGKVLIYCLLCICPVSLVQSEHTTVFELLLDSVKALKGMVRLNVKELYSPPINNLSCQHSAFMCFVNQSSLLQPADGEREDEFNFHLKRIKYIPDVKLNDTLQNCGPCNSHKKKSEKEFLTDFEWLLRRLNRAAMRK